VGEDSLRNPDLVREMEARGSVVSKARLIRRDFIRMKSAKIEIVASVWLLIS